MIKKAIPFVERLFSLLVVFLLLSATTIWSGKFLGHEWLNNSDQSMTEAREISAPTPEEISEMGLKDMILTPHDSITWTVTDGNKEAHGVVMSSLPFSEDIIGYAGTTPLFVYIDEEGRIQGVAAADNDETPGFFRRAAKGILHEWDQMSVSEAMEHEVDAVSGATYTSNSLISNMESVLSAYTSTDMMHHNEPSIGWLRTIVLFLVYAIGIIVAWRFKGVRWLRLLVLILNVGVTGFWCGQFLSLSILHGWIQNGVDFVLYLPTVVMLIIALLLPYMGKRNHYCLWMCPYGSLQELAWRLPLPKIKVGAKTYKRMGKIRLLILMILLGMLWMGYGLSVLDYEPFSAFIISTATPAVMILAAAFVVLGIFIPHPWCQCVCPVGTLLNLAEEKK